MKRNEIVSEIQELIKDKEHLFDLNKNAVSITGEFGISFTVDSITSEGVFIQSDEDVEKKEFIEFDDIMHKDDLQSILEALRSEMIE